MSCCSENCGEQLDEQYSSNRADCPSFSHLQKIDVVLEPSGKESISLRAGACSLHLDDRSEVGL